MFFIRFVPPRSFCYFIVQTRDGRIFRMHQRQGYAKVLFLSCLFLLQHHKGSKLIPEIGDPHEDMRTSVALSIFPPGVSKKLTNGKVAFKVCIPRLIEFGMKYIFSIDSVQVLQTRVPTPV